MMVSCMPASQYRGRLGQAGSEYFVVAGFYQRRFFSQITFFCLKFAGLNGKGRPIERPLFC
ncbi:hypothetical protein SAMN04488518_11717 [Pseudovibrio ascidiaceicola]|uniref:Uncharacterized protein n=1 Tax=Pseudovibrio ascidiaceicola TaxID=285279 RepID=A0A1I4F2U3_9HYPH|nr:hypothetical protein SAMN04488518_11717 [Pseudovibrio ascidiaceicola]